MTDMELLLDEFMKRIDSLSRLNTLDRKNMFYYHNYFFPHSRQTNTTCSKCVIDSLNRLKMFWLEKLVSQYDPDLAQHKLTIIAQQRELEFNKRNNIKPRIPKDIPINLPNIDHLFNKTTNFMPENNNQNIEKKGKRRGQQK